MMKKFINRLNEELDNSCVDEDLNEAIVQDAKAFIDKIKQKVGSALQGAKVFTKKIANKILPFYKKGREFGVVNPSSGIIAAKWAGSKNHMTFMINPNINKSTVKESKIFNEIKSSAEIQKSALKAVDKLGTEIDDVENADDDAVAGIGEAKVDYDDLATILEEITGSLKFRNNFDERVPSLMIMGPPGAGKTSVIKKFAKDEGYNLKIVEVASLYKEVLGGFPIIEKLAKYDDSETAERLKQLKKKKRSELTKDEEDFIKDFEDVYQEFVVNLKSTSALPPNKGGGKWILFLDEFNRDSEKMGAAMNMVLTGNIGTSYYLPLKTVVIASGNIGEDFDGANVEDMDTATWDRFGRRVMLSYDWLGWLEYSEEEFSELEMGKAPAVIRNFVARTTKEKGKNDWTIDLKQFDPDAKARLTPRTLSELSQQMMLAAKNDWERDKLVGKHDKAWYEERYKEKGFPTAAAYYLHVNQLNRHLLGRVVDQTFGPDAGDHVVEMLRGFHQTKEEALSFSADDIVMKWTAAREQMKEKIRPTLTSQFAVKLPDILSSYKTKNAFKKALDSLNIEIPSSIGGDAAVWAAINIHNFLKDSELGLDAAGGIAKELADLRGVPEVEEGEEKKKKPVKNSFLDEVLTFLIKKSDVFGKAWATIADAVGDEASGTIEFKTALAYARQGQLITGDPPKYVTQNLDGQKLKDYLTITNMQMLEPRIIKRSQLQKEKEEMEESLKALFKRIV